MEFNVNIPCVGDARCKIVLKRKWLFWWVAEWHMSSPWRYCQWKVEPLGKFFSRGIAHQKSLDWLESVSGQVV